MQVPIITKPFTFSCMLTAVPLKDEYVRKLIFLHGFEPWVQKIVYQRIDILKTCQGLMKMVECMEDEALACPKGETINGVTQKNQIGPSCGSKGRNK
jgi:hypothetical protein